MYSLNESSHLIENANHGSHFEITLFNMFMFLCIFLRTSEGKHTFIPFLLQLCINIIDFKRSFWLINIDVF